jgi:hypothetical protein
MSAASPTGQLNQANQHGGHTHPAPFRRAIHGRRATPLTQTTPNPRSRGEKKQQNGNST